MHCLCCIDVALPVITTDDQNNDVIINTINHPIVFIITAVFLAMLTLDLCKYYNIGKELRYLQVGILYTSCRLMMLVT